MKTQLIICRECFSKMLKDGKVQCSDGKWRHKLTKDTGEVCRFVHVYCKLGMANESLDEVLKKHANAGRM